MIAEKDLFNAIKASIFAGEAILEIYKKDFDVELKSDLSPITTADKAAHKIIMDILTETEIPVLSEEGKNIPYEERSAWETFWLVDPLDGTKEFIHKNDEFTVNIALIHKNIPTEGIIYVPVFDELYFTFQGQSYKLSSAKSELTDNISELVDKASKLPLYENNDSFKVVASRSHLNEDTSNFIEQIKRIFPNAETNSRGSIFKICMIAEGNAQVYPRFGPTMEWDIAAGHAIAIGAKATIFKMPGYETLLYNKENLLNPHFIVFTKNLKPANLKLS